MTTDKGEEGTRRNNEPAPQRQDLYAILKVDRNASEEAIQRSYKTLSKTFHPDKHAPGPSRDAAQEVFVAFKNAHDILTDPVQRQAYDDLGHVGIAMVKRSLHSADKDPQALYPMLVTLHERGEQDRARLILREAFQQADIEKRERNVRLSATLEFPCTLESAQEGLPLPELQEAHMSFSVSSNPSTPDNKVNVTVGGSTNVENGKGGALAKVEVGHMPVQGTHITGEIDINHPFKLSIGTTRTLSNRTVVTVSARTIPNTNHLGLSIVSHRALLDSALRGTWALGVGSNLKFMYGLLSFTTLSVRYPQCTAKFNLGMSSFPLKLSAKQELDSSGRTGYISYAWGPMGMEVKTILARALSSYSSWSMGIRHATTTGLTWLLQLERNDIIFRIPITLTTRMNPGYWEKLLLLSFVSFVLDEALGDMIRGSDSMDIKRDKDNRKHESSLQFSMERSRQDAEQQVRLMQRTAKVCRVREEADNGLVIRRATYFVQDGNSMDATIQLQFWVKDSKLKLPPTPKSDLLGFYSLATPNDLSNEATWPFSCQWWSKTPKHGVIATPKLTVRYAYQGNVYEITINDTAELVLPNEAALCLGGSHVILA